MLPDDVVRLRHMLEAIEDADVFITNRQRKELDSDKMPRFALVRGIEILGMRNRLVHTCFDVGTEIVWKTVTVELPALIFQLRPLLPDRH